MCCSILIIMILMILMLSLVAETVKNLPAMRETWVQSLGWEDPLEEEIGTLASIPGVENTMDREV